MRYAFVTFQFDENDESVEDDVNYITDAIADLDYALGLYTLDVKVVSDGQGTAEDEPEAEGEVSTEGQSEVSISINDGRS